MNIHIHFFCKLHLILTFLCCMGWTGNAVAQESLVGFSQVSVNSQSKLNVRSGPGTHYEVTGQLSPGEKVTVESLANEKDGWIKIRTRDGHTGYVSRDYVTGYYTKTTDSSRDRLTGYGYPHVPVWSQAHLSVFLFFAGMDPVSAIMLLLIICTTEAMLIALLYLYYKPIRGQRRSSFLAYLVLTTTALLTLPGVPLHRWILSHGNAGDITIYLLMLLSTGCLMLHAVWRIKLCGMDEDYDPDSANYHIGRWVGNALWCILLIPFTKIWWKVCDAPAIPISGSFGMLLVMSAIMAAFNWIAIKWIWPHGIVRWLFQSANQGIVHIMSFIVFWGVLSYEYKLLDANFNGFTYLAGLFLGFLIVIMTVGYAWNAVTVSRCAKCHSYDTGLFNVSDLGYRYRTHRDWQDINESSVKRRHPDSIVSDARRQVEITEKIHTIRDHYVCHRCRNTWELDHNYTVGRSSRTIKKEWTEHY